MPDGRPPCTAAEPSIGQQGNGCIETHAGDDGRRGQHLPHARSAFGTFIADDNNISGFDLSTQDGRNRVVFGVKDTGFALIDQHVTGHGRLLDHRTIRGQIPAKDGDSALLRIGIIEGPDDLFVQNSCRLQIFTDRFTGDGHGFLIDDTQWTDPLHHRLNAAGCVKILDMMGACRRKFAEVGCFFAEGVKQIEIHLDACFVGNGRDVENGIGRAAEGHIHGNRIFKGGKGGNIPRFDILFQKLHDFHARFLGQATPGGMNR